MTGMAPTLRVCAAAVAAGIVVGTWLCKRPLPRQADPALIVEEGGRHVMSSDGKRLVEYFVGGSSFPTATTVVIVTGGGCTGKLVLELTRKAAERLNVKVIAISLPGWGYGTIHPRLPNYYDWAESDVRPVLAQERVGMFVVAGASHGAPFAMAIAHRFRMGVLGLGLRVPFLPPEVTDPAELPRYRAYMAPKLADNALPFGWLIHLLMAPLSTRLTAGSLDWLIHRSTYWNFKRDYPEEFELLYADKARANTHYGHMALLIHRQMFNEWGFDPRELTTRKRLLWHAPDDQDVPPSHGKWLGDFWTSTAASPGDVIVKEVPGYGHLGGGFADYDAFLTQLMGMVEAGAPKIASLVRC